MGSMNGAATSFNTDTLQMLIDEILYFSYFYSNVRSSYTFIFTSSIEEKILKHVSIFILRKQII